MYRNQKMGALLLMAGSGLRFKSPEPKQFHLLAQKPVFAHALKALVSTAVFDEIVLVHPPGWQATIQGVTLVEGGKTRQESSWKGISSFQNFPDIVLIHDAVRPFLSRSLIFQNLDAAIDFGAADTCIPSADTVVHSKDRSWITTIPNRNEFLRGQTPQTFQIEKIIKAHEKALLDKIENATDDCQLLLRLGEKVKIVLGEETNIKITTSIDLVVAEQLLRQTQLLAESPFS